MPWWGWLITAGVAVVLLCAVVVLITVVRFFWRETRDEIRHVEHRIGSPLWTYETHKSFPPPIRGTGTPARKPGASPKKG